MSPRPRHPKNRDLPEHLYPYPDGRYVYERPTDGRRFSLGTDRARAIRVARKLNAELKPPEYAREAALVARVLGLDTGAPLTEALSRFQAEYLPERNLAETTRLELKRMLAAIDEALGVTPPAEISVRMIAHFLDQYPPNAGNKYRALLVQVFRFCIAKGLCETNPAEATLKKVEKVQRQRLSLEAFQAIRAAVEPWMQNAMDLAIQTLQRRQDIVAMRFEDIVEGRLLVKQRKVERHGSGHLAIKISPALQAVIDRCRDEVASPFLVHRRPRKLRADHRQGKEHWTQVKPESATRAFQEARDRLGLYANLTAEAKPSFHEIRALGAQKYKEAGIDPQSLLGHTTAKMTNCYLRGHDNVKWVEVDAGLAI